VLLDIIVGADSWFSTFWWSTNITTRHPCYW